MKTIHVSGLVMLALIQATSWSQTPHGKQKELTCPADWEDFCGGWTIVDNIFADGGTYEEHLSPSANDRFVVGEKGNRLFLFPRGDLRDRWGPQVQLDQVTQGGMCLIGRVRLGHPDPVRWHYIKLTAGFGFPEGANVVGEEVVLSVQFRGPLEEQPDSCAWPLPPTAATAMNRDHNGIVHAED